jgi:hypothetical protein
MKAYLHFCTHLGRNSLNTVTCFNDCDRRLDWRIGLLDLD